MYEAKRLMESGTVELSLLGQNVNAYLIGHVLTLDMQVAATGGALPWPMGDLRGVDQPVVDGRALILLRIEVDHNVGRLYHHAEIRWRGPAKVLLQKGVVAVLDG